MIKKTLFMFWHQHEYIMYSSCLENCNLVQSARLGLHRPPSAFFIHRHAPSASSLRLFRKKYIGIQCKRLSKMAPFNPGEFITGLEVVRRISGVPPGLLCKYNLSKVLNCLNSCFYINHRLNRYIFIP